MAEMLHKLVNEDKLEKIRFERSQSGKKRLNEIAINQGSKTDCFLNVKEELKGTIKMAESILNSKDVEQEYQNMLDSFGMVNTKILDSSRNQLLSKFSNDVYFTRLFTKHMELFGSEVKKSTLQSIEKKKQTPVNFFDGK